MPLPRIASEPPTSKRPRSATYRARKIHRYLGLVIGIQFLLWTAGGLYFSWIRLSSVRGENLRAAPPRLDPGAPLASPSAFLNVIAESERVDSVTSLELISLLGRPVYRATYTTRVGDSAITRVRLADATTGVPRPPVSRDEAVALARESFVPQAAVRSVALVTAANVNGQHEYRAQPLPAWAVKFDHSSGATAYVAAELGQVQAIRNTRWRAFDFLWMLHTMDYRSRDDFNNTLLRVVSVLGMATILSGFVLFALTSPVVRRRRRRGGDVTPEPEVLSRT